MKSKADVHIDEQVIFIHNPRAAGTSVRRALAHGKDPNLTIPWPGNVPTAWTTNSKHAFAGTVRVELADSPLVPDGAWETRFKFAVVRNPHERLVSLYGLFRRPTEPARQAKYLVDGKHPHKIDKFILALNPSGVNLEAMRKVQKKRLCNLALGLGFKDWLLGFCEEYHWNPCRYLDSERPITRIQQVEWFGGLDKVFKFEELDELHDGLVERGYPVPRPENQTDHAPWESYYDAETHDWVSEIFRDDIRRFGY